MFDLFMPFDTYVLSLVHNLADIGILLNKFMALVSFFGENISIFGYMGIGLILFKKTRKVGSILLFTLFISLVSELALKEIFDRTRPFLENDIFYGYWVKAGAIFKDHSSFPSGHVARTLCSIIVLYRFIKEDKKYAFVLYSIVFSVLMILSRMYLMHHYPSDCIGGLILGIICAIIGSYVGEKMYNFIYDHKDIKLFNFIIEFDVIKIFTR